MTALLQQIITGNTYVFLIIFMRLGSALMVMPGVGDSFVSPQIRLLFALALSCALTPVLAHRLPAMPADLLGMMMLLIGEFAIGVFIGSVMRILMSALDTAGLIVSMQTGFANAMIFNPVTSTQGSIVGAIYSMLGVTLLMVTDMHHYMLATVTESYALFPAALHMMPMDDVFEIIVRTTSAAFTIGVQMAMPFIVVGTLLQYGIGLINRLMPQIQIFFIAMPLQIAISLALMAITLGVAMMYWLNSFGTLLRQFTEL